MTQKEQKNPFQDTLNLPTTTFSIRANAQEMEPTILKQWQDAGIAQQVNEKNRGKEKFVLHDGPPYTNGHLHMGHALNKTLKDIVCKSRRMAGFYVPFVVGWDCHGLPIELKVASQIGIAEQKSALHKEVLKAACREYASSWVSVQRKEFEDLGIFFDQNEHYETMSPSYEAAIVRSFAKFVDGGYIERKGKTVPWCASCQTVLAVAEIEYKDRKDPSIYVMFPVADQLARMTFPFAFEKHRDLQISFLVWTTTPWTLPLNRAIVLNPEAEYAVVKMPDSNAAFIVAKGLADKVCSILGIEKNIVAEFDAVIFQGKQVGHPFIDDMVVPVLLDESVLTQEGTAVLHSAPGCGPDDYLLGLKHGLEIFSPLSDDGKYTLGIAPAELEGMKVTDGQIWVLRKLTEKGRLLHKVSITHSYPHCWRCRNGLMFRATDQWFCDLQKNNLVLRTLTEIEKNIEFIPEWGKQRLLSFVGNRAEWCISRQRQWGTPIPALHCRKCNWTFVDSSFINKVADKIAQDGIEYWDRVTLTDLVEDGVLDSSFGCKQCGNEDFADFRKEEDILDVWFDSGISHYAVLSQNEEKLGLPADLYLEGSDQHRGWFQSSLLCGMVLNGKAPYKKLLTHGYVVDEKKHKMSKSLGNGVEPSEVIKKYSRDILRLWVASADYENDIVISDKLLANVAEIYRKIRNTCRFLLSNLHGFDSSKDMVDVSDMLMIDQFALAQLYELNDKVQEAYQQYHFSAVVQLLNNYCTNDLSAMYLDILKDRLYCEKENGPLRRSGQTVLFIMLDVLTRLMAPIMSFTAEEVASHVVGAEKGSVHLRSFVQSPDVWSMLKLEDQHVLTHVYGVVKSEHALYRVKMQGFWEMLQELRGAVFKALEKLRQAGIIKHSLESKVTIFAGFTDGAHEMFEDFVKEHKSSEDMYKFFKDWLIVSHVEFAQTGQDLEATDLNWLRIKVEHADGVKCPRCWQWGVSMHEAGLCKRCELVIL
jgi:isoleucyl-tRNA synthetase